MARSKKRRRQGRKLKTLPRTPSGRLSRSAARRTIERAQRDEETRASLARLRNDRARGLGLTEEQAAVQFERSLGLVSETIAGRMALRGALSFTQAEAINEYAKLVRRVMNIIRAPAGTRCSLNADREGEGLDDIESYIQTMREYNNAFGAVREVGVRACRAVNLVVRDFLEPPASELPWAQAGGAALARHFGLDERRAAA